MQSILLVLAIILTLPAGPDDAKIKQALDAFKAKVKETKAPKVRASLILELAEQEPKGDRAYACEIGKYLKLDPSDLNYEAAVASDDAISRFRGNPVASQMLAAALPAYQRVPLVFNRVLTALGKVGHPSAFQVFEGYITGTDPDLAEKALHGPLLGIYIE